MEEKDPDTTKRSMKPWIIYLVIFGAIFVLLTLNTDPKKGEETKMNYREFKALLDSDLIIEAKIKFWKHKHVVFFETYGVFWAGGTPHLRY